jgi:hypothetical protein
MTAPALRKPKRKFTADEDAVIKSMVNVHGPRKWRLAADQLPGRTARQCRERWLNYLSPDVSRAPWAAAEDGLLRAKVAELGPIWCRIASAFVGRTDVCVKNRYLKLARGDRKAARRSQKRAEANVGDDGGAFFLDDDQTGHDDWQYDSLYCMPTEFGEFCSQ